MHPAALRAEEEQPLQVLGEGLSLKAHGVFPLALVGVLVKIGNDALVDLLRAHRAQLLGGVYAHGLAVHLPAADGVARPAGACEVSARELVGDERRAARARELADRGEKLRRHTIPGAVALRENAHVHPAAEIAHHRENGARGAAALLAGDGGLEPSHELAAESRAEQMLACDKIGLLRKTARHEDGVPVRDMVAHKQIRAFDVRFFTGKAEFDPADELCERAQRFPYKYMAAASLHGAVLLHMQASFAAVHNILSYSIHHFLSQFKPEEREIPLFFRREMCYSLK